MRWRCTTSFMACLLGCNSGTAQGPDSGSDAALADAGADVAAPRFVWSHSTPNGVSTAKVSASSGLVAVAGAFNGTIDLGGPSPLVAVAQTDGGVVLDGFVAAYREADGTFLWQHQIASDAGDTHVVMVVAASGAVYVMGQIVGSADFGTGPLQGNPQGAFVVRYGAGGQPQWADVFPGTDIITSIDGLALGPSGDVLFSGSFGGTLQVGTYAFPSSFPYWSNVLGRLNAQDGGVVWAALNTSQSTNATEFGANQVIPAENGAAAVGYLINHNTGDSRGAYLRFDENDGGITTLNLPEKSILFSVIRQNGQVVVEGAANSPIDLGCGWADGGTLTPGGFLASFPENGDGGCSWLTLTRNAQGLGIAQLSGSMIGVFAPSLQTYSLQTGALSTSVDAGLGGYASFDLPTFCTALTVQYALTVSCYQLP